MKDHHSDVRLLVFGLRRKLDSELGCVLRALQYDYYRLFFDDVRLPLAAQAISMECKTYSEIR